MLDFEFSPEQQAIKDLARRFAREEIMPRASECDDKELFATDLYARAFHAGLMNLEVPEALGGPGLGCVDVCLVTEELNYGCAGISNGIGTNSLAALPLLIAGNQAQQQRYLGALTREPILCAFALTEPAAGSDVAGIASTYRREGDGFVLNGTKHFISNGSYAQWLVTFASADRSLRHRGLSCFVMPADWPGISRTRMHGKLGQRAADTAEIVFEDVRLPAQALVGEEGRGFEYAMRSFDRSRPHIGAIAAGISQRALDEALRYAGERNAFGRPIAQFQAIQFMLADMAIALEAMRLLTYKAAWWVDQGRGRNPIASYAKAFAADACMKITTDAVQIFGGYGYMKAYPVEKLMRDAKLLQIYEGTSQVQRLVIARDLMRT